jgi:hypothetical protein
MGSRALGRVLYFLGKSLLVITGDRSRAAGISIKSVGSWRVKSENLKFFLLLLPQELSSKSVNQISLFFVSNAQVALTVAAMKIATWDM